MLGTNLLPQIVIIHTLKWTINQRIIHKQTTTENHKINQNSLNKKSSEKFKSTHRKIIIRNLQNTSQILED